MPALPSGYSSRPVRVEDAPALVTMLNLDAEQQVGEPQFTVDEYTIDLEEPGFDREESSRIVLAPDGSAAGVVELYAHAPYVRPFAWVRVHPEHTGRGIGTALTQWAEARARADLYKAPANARVSLHSSAYSSNRDAEVLLAELGFQQARLFLSMRIELAAPPPEPVWPEGIRVRTMILGVDDRAIYQAMDEAFSDHWGHVQQAPDDGFERWIHHKASDPQFDPALHFLALDGDEIAGISLCSPAPGDEFNVGWIDQLAVRRRWRQRGLAQALLMHTFGAFYARGTTKVGLGVDSDSLTGATRLYEKVGMYVHHSNVAYEKELRPGVELATVAMTS